VSSARASPSPSPEREPRVFDEDAPLFTDAPPPFGAATRAVAEMERMVLEADGLVLRYGWFYGPGTFYGEGGSTAKDVARRRFPVIGEVAAAGDADAIGARRPLRVPVWLARRVAGKAAAAMSTTLPGASNARARRELAWEPRWASWRTGFLDAPR
jgi:2-alkyl-3-oxoalkanoate reductase